MTTLKPGSNLADVFVMLADSLRDDYDVIDTMDLLVQAATHFTSAVEAGILLRDAEGNLHVVASTSERASDVEEAQLGADEGPCLASIQSGEPVEVPDIVAESTKWPRFTFAAKARGLQSAHAIPLRLRTQVLGGLNLFSDRPGLFSDRDAAIALALAQVATISILQNQTITNQGVVAAQLQHALDSRVIIEQAKGVLAHQHGVAMDRAFALLRSHARNNNIGLRAVADQVVNDRLVIL
jgi:GAF domain-containing protein